MGQKVNPHGLRVGVIKNWESRWFASDKKFGDTLVSDYNLREYLKKEYFNAGISKIEIERDSKDMVKVFVHCAKPGMLIGKAADKNADKTNEKPKGPTEIVKIRTAIEKLTGKKAVVNIVEVRPIELDAQLVAESICSQLERRVAFRRAMKQAIGRTMRLAKGIKIAVSGRVGGAEIARTEQYHEGTIPLQTIRADIDYGFWEANTTYGKLGVKVWIYKGEVLSEVSKTTEEKPKKRYDHKGKSDRKGGERKEHRAPRAPKNNEGGEH